MGGGKYTYMKTIIKLALTIVVLFSCYTAIQLLQEIVIQPRISSVHPTSSDMYLIYKMSDVPVYKGSGMSTPSHQSNKSTAMPAVSPWSSAASPFTGKSSINNSTAQVSMYENIGALVPSINLKQSSPSQTMGYSDNGFYAYGGSSTKEGGGSSAGYGLANRLSNSAASAGLLYVSPADPVDPDNMYLAAIPETLPVGNGVWVLLLLAAGYLASKQVNRLTSKLVTSKQV